MALKETPVCMKQYYKLFIESNTKELNKYIQIRSSIKDILYNEHKELKKQIEKYKTDYNINLTSYKEFNDNQYYNGEFFKDTKGLFMNRRNDYKLVSELFDLFKYAKHMKELYDVEHKIAHLNKLVNLKYKEYSSILRTYYTEVHKKLILNGDGYAFSNNIGWICVNRVKTRLRRPMLDFAATKKREAELKAEGKRIYNEKEAEWCRKNGIEYKAEDKRVFKHDEYFYEIPLLNSKLPGGHKLKLEPSDYRHTSVRGKTNQQLIDICNNDIKKICELPIDVKTKLTLCNLVDKTIYYKFIRNEHQKSYKFRQTNR